jgi:flagellar biosynthesis protein FlhA
VAASTIGSRALQKVQSHSDTVFAVGLFGLMAIMIMPLPPIALDMLLVCSISISLLVFLLTIYAKRPVEFSIFPTLLLITTVFRLSLNVASTRLILIHGGEGEASAGKVIDAFGRVVVGGNYVVGLVVFIILVVINFVVITKGAGRVAEVAARFTLDAMPGKQMAIDAELNAGHIDEKMAKKRRADVSKEADFYGAMDGASKFIRGDAIAGIIITLVNIVGGIIIGVLQNGMSAGEATRTYTLLTIGDGLVGQIPALVISAAAGMLVTRVVKDADQGLDKDMGQQLFGKPRVLGILSAILFSMCLMMPGVRLPFFIMATVFAVLAIQIARQQASSPTPSGEPGDETVAPALARPEDLLALEPLSMEVGIDLVYLVDQRKGGELLERIQRIRNQFAQDLGVVLPPVHLRDNLRLEKNEYVLLLRGEEIGRGKVHARQHLAIDPGDAHGKIRGIKTVDPVFDLEAYWIPDTQVVKAQSSGYTVVDVPTVLATHLTELMHVHAHELYDMAQLSHMLERMGDKSPKLVEDLVPDILPRQTVLKIFRNLVREGVSARDSQTILEALGEYAPKTKDADLLTEFVRQRLARHISSRFSDEDGTIHYLALGPGAEEAITQSLQTTEAGGMNLVLSPDIARVLISKVKDAAEANANMGTVVLLAPPLARGPLSRLIEKVVPRLPVLSPAELIPTIKLNRVVVVDVGIKG